MLATFFLSVTGWLAVVAFALFLLYRFYSSKHRGFWESQGIPCVKANFLHGTLFTIFKSLHVLEEEQYTKLGRVYGRYDNKIPVLTVGDPDALKKILVKDFHIFPDRRDLKFGVPAADNILSSLNGEDWKRVRSIISPTFTSGKLRKMLPLIDECLSSVLSRLHEHAESNESVDCERIFSAYTVDVIASCAYGAKINSLEKPDNPFLKYGELILADRSNLIPVLTLMFPFLMKWFKISLFNFEALSFFKSFVLDVAQQRKNEKNQTRIDFLQLMLDAENTQSPTDDNFEENKEKTTMSLDSINKHKSLSYDELVANCIVFFVAGYDPTISLLQFTAYQLAMNHTYQERLVQEIDENLGRNKEITYESLGKMTYLDAVLSESLRLVSPGVRVERKAGQDYFLEEIGVKIKKNTLISIPIYAIHHDPEWYPEPYKFDPERFTPEAIASRHSFVYLPFGVGPRGCVGMRFALMVVKVCLIKILQQFKFVIAPETKIPPGIMVRLAVLKCKKVVLKVEKR